MKTAAIIFAMTLSVIMKANDEKYNEVMTKNIEAIYKAQTLDEMQNAVNVFDRIANAEKTKWEPLYYSAFGHVLMANKEIDAARKDNYLDLALSAIEKAKTIKPDDSEIIAMEGFIHMIRVTVDPSSRGQEFSSKAFEAYNKALAINPGNPRALALLAQIQFGTAQFFGASTAEACATAANAIEKFETDKPGSQLAPVWGRGITEELKAKCK